jgi:hypothetical protein
MGSGRSDKHADALKPIAQAGSAGLKPCIDCLVSGLHCSQALFVGQASALCRESNHRKFLGGTGKGSFERIADERP